MMSRYYNQGNALVIFWAQCGKVMLSKKEGKLAFTDDKINANSKKQISYLLPLPKMDNICCHYAYEQTDPLCPVTLWKWNERRDFSHILYLLYATCHTILWHVEIYNK